MRMSDSQMEDASLMVQPVKAKKNVQWGTVQVVEFRVGYSPCTIPSAGGPPVGIRGRAISTAEYPLGNDPDEIEQEDLRPKADPMDVWIDPMERVRILQEQNGFRLEDVALVCAEVRAIQDSRAFSYLDFDSSHALRHGDLQHLQVLRDVRYTPREQPREKIVLLEQQESTRTHLMV
ncbi:hypothetical protein Poli38472_013806 [Pythium oligandrum]|uniref:Uncharacterized protein n=1 Tax=Pythium oligandrum TaxID=41045 RepID=A0A8K1C235_PYTOL|nr:hypothetical protein Poli38472_013806 [Pythium oligandrum]|eukprot:TMW55044.1 hypothetical protein Poli38472_013806 [Pythium oligandrum]